MYFLPCCCSVFPDRQHLAWVDSPTSARLALGLQMRVTAHDGGCHDALDDREGSLASPSRSLPTGRTDSRISGTRASSPGWPEVLGFLGVQGLSRYLRKGAWARAEDCAKALKQARQEHIQSKPK